MLPVTIMGEFQLEEWTAKDGTQKSALACNVNSVQMQRKEQTVTQQAPKPVQSNTLQDDDIPF